LDFSEREQDEILASLTIERRYNFENYIKERMKERWHWAISYFRKKSFNKNMNEEQIATELQDWILVDLRDTRFHPTKCECGKTHRFLFIINHPKKELTYSVGEECIDNQGLFPDELLLKIKKYIREITRERIELLWKIKNQDFFNPDEFRDIDIPDEFLLQTNKGIPLTNKQILTLLNKQNKHYLMNQKKKSNEEWLEKMKQSPNKYVISSLESEINKYFKKLKTHVNIVKCQNYDDLCKFHLDEMKLIRAKEVKIPISLIDDWHFIQETFRKAKREESFNYPRFKLLVDNLKNALEIK
jgi:hypothetical protein